MENTAMGKRDGGGGGGGGVLLASMQGVSAKQK